MSTGEKKRISELVKYKKNMDFPVEVWSSIFKYLRLVDLVEISCVCKKFYVLCQRNQYYVKKLRSKIYLMTDLG